MLPVTAESSRFPHPRSVVRSLTEPLDDNSDRPAQWRHWISSLGSEDTSAERFGRLVREHWSIENGSHRTRDVLWREDHQRFKHHGRAHVLASIRQVALWLHRGIQSGTIRNLARPNIPPGPISRQAKQLSHNAQAAFPLILNDPRE